MGRLEKIKEVKGAALGLQIYPTHILAHDANGHQLQTTQQQYKLNQGREALDRLAPDQCFDQKSEGVQKRAHSAEKPHVSGDAQRHGRKRRDAFQRKIPEPPIGPLALTGRTGLAVVIERHLIETNP